RRHTRSKRDWSSDVCSSDLHAFLGIEKTALTSGKKIREDAERTQKEQREQIEKTNESLKEYFAQFDSGNLAKAAGDMYLIGNARSEERRVGEEWSDRGWAGG